MALPAVAAALGRRKVASIVGMEQYARANLRTLEYSARNFATTRRTVGSGRRALRPAPLGLDRRRDHVPIATASSIGDVAQLSGWLVLSAGSEHPSGRRRIESATGRSRVGSVRRARGQNHDVGATDEQSWTDHGAGPAHRPPGFDSRELLATGCDDGAISAGFHQHSNRIKRALRSRARGRP